MKHPKKKRFGTFLLVVASVLLAGIKTSDAQSIPDQSLLKAHAPARFSALFHTTKGDFILEVYRDWSPLAADRLYQLIASGFYDQNILFRVQKNFVVQWGIGDHAAINAFWDKRAIADEPVLQPNTKGTVAYARDGMCSRTAQLFVNMKDNPKLDTVNFNGLRGFPPVGKITEGFSVFESLYGEYGFEPANYQDSVMVQGNVYLEKHFPNLDRIISATILER
jgi:cyclophilin family peptidyl-prolyl cis-trans isomerase